MGKDILIETRDLTKIYGDGQGVRALDGVDLSIRDGEMVAIVPKEEATEQRLISEYLGFSNGEEV